MVSACPKQTPDMASRRKSRYFDISNFSAEKINVFFNINMYKVKRTIYKEKALNPIKCKPIYNLKSILQSQFNAVSLSLNSLSFLERDKG